MMEPARPAGQTPAAASFTPKLGGDDALRVLAAILNAVMARIRWPDPRDAALALFLSVAATIVTAFLFPEPTDSILVGLLVLVISGIYELRKQVVKWAETTLQTTDKVLARLITYLKVERAYSEDDWLIRLMDDMLTLKKDTQQRMHEEKRLKVLLQDAVDTARRESGQPYSPAVKHEYDRAVHLKDAISTATSYVNAVTLDVNGYFDRFWDDLFGEAYVRSNLAAAERNVTIQRIRLFPHS